MNRNPGSNRRNSTTNLTALISFDPKSNTLIRVREHHNSDSEDESNAVVINKSDTSWISNNIYPAQPIKNNLNSNLVPDSNFSTFENFDGAISLAQRSESRVSI